MNRSRHPDPTIAAWLADGPTELSTAARDAIAATVRTTRRRRRLALSRPDLRRTRPLAWAAVLLTVVLTLAVAAGAAGLLRPTTEIPVPTAVGPLPTEIRVVGPPPTESPTPTPNRGRVSTVCWAGGLSLTVPGQGTIMLRGSAVSMDYSVPVALDLDAWAADGVVGFGLPIGRRGVAVVDVSQAVRHGSTVAQPRIGSNAQTFLPDLDEALPSGDGVIDFEVDDVEATQLAGRPAWSARVSVPELDPPMWSHIDTLANSDRTCAVEFGMPNRIWVFDVGSSIVLVQAWATDEAGLTAWLPEATRLVDTFRFRSDQP